MKKIIAVCLALVIAASTTLTVFAAPGLFWSSPSGQPAPIVINFDPANDACTATLVITPYVSRDDLTDAQRELIEKAYKSIANAKTLTDLNANFASFVASQGIDAKYLAVSNLFDIHVIGCEFHEGHNEFDITLSVDSLHNFVGLLHMNQDGVWEMVPDAHVEQNETHIVFSVEGFSPFAIIVDTTGEPPQTGDSIMIICTVVMAASIIALACVMHKRKKQIAQ